MPLKQTKMTNYYPKKTYRKKVAYRKTLTKANRRKDLYFFKRSFFQKTITGNLSYQPFLDSIVWQFSQLPNYTDFTSLFDRYKVTYVKLYVHLNIDPSAQSAVNASFPKLYYVKDYDDNTNPTSLDELREHSRCQVKVLNPNRPIVIRCKPSSLVEIARTGGSTPAGSPRWNQWIDAQLYPDVEHYGLKMGIDNLTNTNYKVDIYGKMWFQCKDIR